MPTNADAYLGDKNEMQQAEVARTLVHIEERSGKNIGLPDAVKSQGTGVDKDRAQGRLQVGL